MNPFLAYMAGYNIALNSRGKPFPFELFLQFLVWMFKKTKEAVVTFMPILGVIAVLILLGVAQMRLHP